MSRDNSRYWKNSTVEMRAAGFDPERTAKLDAVVTIGSPYTNAHRCNNRVREVADLLIETLAEHNAQGLLVGSPAVSDALTQGTPAAGYSLVSRDLIADCVELAHNTHHGNAMLMVSGCDKVGAAALMPLARCNDVGMVIYPGTSSPGKVDIAPWSKKGNNLTIMDWAEARAAKQAGRISDVELVAIERAVMPGSGTCGAMFTANTMSVIAEAMGMMLPKGASHPADYGAQSAIHDDVQAQARASAAALMHLMREGIRPRDIMTRAAFENAITTAYAMGGSTNLYLHLLAIAREADVALTIEDIQQVGERVPMDAIREGDIVAGDVVVVRNVGPVGAPGMPEMVMLTIQLQGRGLGADVALITDGRFSGVSHGILIGHISPEAARGGPIAAVRDGDTITIDPGARTLDVALTDAEIEARMADWRAPELLEGLRPGSVRHKFVRLVSSAHYGCVQ